MNPVSFSKEVLLLFLVLAAVGTAIGCGGGETQAVADASHERLEGVDPDQRIVFACKMKTLPEKFPLESGERELLRGPNSILIEATAAAFDRLSKTPGVGTVMVWGDPGQVKKMDPWLQAQVMNAWSQDEPIDISCLAQFEKGTVGLRKKLEALGVQPRTVAGIVVTLDGPAPALIELLQLPELQALTQPKNLVPLERRTGG